MKASRRRRKQHLHFARVEISGSEIEHLARLGYKARADDPNSIGQVITAFIADSAFNATG